MERANSHLKALDAKALNRDKLREEGTTLQAFKTKCEGDAQRRDEMLRVLAGPRGDREILQKATAVVEEKPCRRVMGLGEYVHWTYVEVLRGKPNYAAYVGMGSERRSKPKTLFQEWMHGNKGDWSYQREIDELENNLAEPKTMLENES